jgi:hypothetical protein
MACRVSRRRREEREEGTESWYVPLRGDLQGRRREEKLRVGE